MENLLQRILDEKRGEVAALSTRAGRLALERELASAPPPRDFRRALAGGAGFRVIAELKRASPSRGILCVDYDPARLAVRYQEGGACALSVLTDRAFFQGSERHLREARGAVSLPVLRKDFLIDPVQVQHARALGADAVLLIAAVLPRVSLEALLQASRQLGMATLVEVHDSVQLEMALDAGADLIGVNNRDLRSFRESLAVSLELAERIPASVLRVSESGITGRKDLEVLSEAGYRAFLVGEALLTHPDPVALLKEWTR